MSLIEVEQKFRVSSFEAVEAKLHHWGAELRRIDSQIDTYFSHPSRDFAQTGEALRIRDCGDQSWLCYKGSRRLAEVKSREEIELPIRPTDRESWQVLLERIGFRPVAQVRKNRRSLALDARPNLTISLDDVAGCGLFVEVEMMVDESSMDDASRVIREISLNLGLVSVEPRSYLSMILSDPS